MCLYTCEDLDLNSSYSSSYGSFKFCKYPEGYTDKELFYIPDEFTGSDYSGSLYNKANHDAFLKDFKREGIYDVYGGFCTYAVAIRKDVAQQDDIKEVLEEVQNFGIYSQETCDALEEEYKKRAWKNWLRSDLVRQINHKVEGLKWSERNILRLFYEACNETNTEWESDGGNTLTINEDGIATYIAEEIIAKKTSKKELALLLGKSWGNIKAEELLRSRLQKG